MTTKRAQMPIGFGCCGPKPQNKHARCEWQTKVVGIVATASACLFCGPWVGREVAFRAQRSRVAAFSKPVGAIAEDCGVTRTRCSDYAFSHKGSLLRIARGRIGRMLEALVRTTTSSSARALTSLLRCVCVCVRMRKFAETSSLMARVWNHWYEQLDGSESLFLFVQDIGPTQKVFDTELRNGVLKKKASATTGGTQHLAISGGLRNEFRPRGARPSATWKRSGEEGRPIGIRF